MRVELVLELGERNLAAAGKQAVDQLLLIDAQLCGGLEQCVGEVVVGGAEPACALHRVDADHAAPGQVDDGGDDVLQVGALVDQRAHDAGRQVGGRIGHVVGHQPHRLVAALLVPVQVEADGAGNGDEQRQEQ